MVENFNFNLKQGLRVILKEIKDFGAGPCAVFETDNPFSPEMRLCKEPLKRRIENIEKRGYEVTDQERMALYMLENDMSYP